MSKRAIPRAEALAVADSLIKVLGATVKRIEVAGSLRRGKPTVGDVELLFIPKMEMRSLDFFCEVPFDLTNDAIEKLVAEGVLGKRLRDQSDIVAGWGPKNKLAFHCSSGIAVDLFSTPEENWWTSLVIRSGGKDTNLSLTTGAIKIGRHLMAYGSGIIDKASGQVIRATSEQHVFELCGVPYLEPEARA